MENPKCPYCGGEMRYAFNGDIVGTHFLICETCLSRSPVVSFDDDPYAAAMKREKKYREQVEFDVKAALNALNCNSYQMPYHIYSMLFDKISVIGYTPTKRGADMREEAKDDYQCKK